MLVEKIFVDVSEMPFAFVYPKFVVVAFVNTAGPETLRFVPVADVKTRRLVFALVVVIEVPFAFTKENRPDRFRFVEVTLPPLIFVNPIKAAKRLVEVALIRVVLPRATVPLAEKLVEVRLVKTPVFGVVAPMVVLLMVPPTMVRASATMASVTELFGKAKVPETFKFVVVALVTVMFVPFAVVKVRPASEVAPVILRLVEVALIRVVLPRATVPLAEKLVEVRLDIVTLPKLVGPVMFRLVAEMLVEVSEVPLERVNDSLVVVIEVNIPLVEVRLVKTPVLGVVAPIAEPLIGVLIIEPALIVILSTTMASVIEFEGRLRAPLTYRLVLVIFVPVALRKVIP